MPNGGSSWTHTEGSDQERLSSSGMEMPFVFLYYYFIYLLVYLVSYVQEHTLFRLSVGVGCGGFLIRSGRQRLWLCLSVLNPEMLLMPVRMCNKADESRIRFDLKSEGWGQSMGLSDYNAIATE